MVTLRDREPETYEELPVYFRTRDAARSYHEEMEYWRAVEWSWRDEDQLVVAPAPDDVHEDDIAWDDEP